MDNLCESVRKEKLGLDEPDKTINRKKQLDNSLGIEVSRSIETIYTPEQSLANVILSLINPGDEVLLPAPFWVSYVEQVKLAGGIPIEIQTSIETEFKITPEQLRASINEKTKLIISKETVSNDISKVS